ncbi:hypothetical protein K439DRAFT_1665123 [Ramaria rubella]|nr:hypothetical protein K439DRAFT_1665123 [Ramaria rubella]
MGIPLNTVAHRVIHCPEMTLLDMLREIQSEQIVLSKHENITVVDLDSASIPVSGLFKSILNIRNAGTATPQPVSSMESRLLAEYCKGGLGILNYPFSLSVDVLPMAAFSVGVVHAADIIPEAEVNVILDHLDTMLFFMIHHSDALVHDVELINANEPRRLIPVVNTEQQPNAAQNISDLIDMQVQKTLQRIVLQFDQEAFLMYVEMDGLPMIWHGSWSKAVSSMAR